MLRSPACQVFDLLAAGDAGRHQLDGRARGLDRRCQTPIAYRQRQIVVLFFEAKGTGHTAAARIDFADFEAGLLENRDSRPRPDQGFLMAVAVEQDFAITVAPTPS